jgi:ketosteroid isomerase-like protein
MVLPMFKCHWIPLLAVALSIVVPGALHSDIPFNAQQETVAGEQSEPNSTSDITSIRNILARQTAAWNRGDLNEFMETYWKSKDLTFSGGGRTTRGWQATLDRYKSRYAPPNEMGVLRFEQLEISMLADTISLVLGNWHLKMKDGSDRTGNFSLVCKKFEGQWRIVHDHSSTLDKDN